MEWNVYYYNLNLQKIETYNIFKHGGFVKGVKEIIKRSQDKAHFETALKTELMYYFWSKSQWEIIISPWCGNKKPCDVKIDVFNQVMMNWSIFVNYCWDNREEILKIE